MAVLKGVGRTHRTFLELYVESYIRSHRRKVLPKNVVQRAIALIDMKLENPCCTDPEAVTDLVTSSHGNFLRGFEQMLNQITKKGNVVSLQNTKTLLQKNIGIPCCD